MISKYWKAITALVVGLLTWGQLVINSPASDITNEEWSVLIGTIIAAIGVFLVPNAQPVAAPAANIPPPAE